MYIGATRLEIPSTTNSEETSSITVMVDGNYTQEQYIDKIRKSYSSDEGYDEKSASKVKIGNEEGYQMTAMTLDYIKQDLFIVKDGKVYIIEFFGNEKEHSNLKNDINEFVNNFNV